MAAAGSPSTIGGSIYLLSPSVLLDNIMEAPLTPEELITAETVAADDDERRRRSSSSSRNHHHQNCCLVCYAPLDSARNGTGRRLTVVAPCGHSDICPPCHLRLRHLHGDRKCPICKRENDSLVVDYADRAGNRSFAEYPVWGTDLGADFVHADAAGMFFPVEYYRLEVQPLFGYHCTVPGCEYSGTVEDSSRKDDGAADGQGEDRRRQQEAAAAASTRHQSSALRALQDHLRLRHRLALCNLCAEHKRDFVARLPRFGPSGLHRHLTAGDDPSSGGLRGHPVCEFCRPTRFYDITELHRHLHKEHYQCHVCEQQGVLNQFFANYRSLERHFDQQHFLCHDVQCLTARFVVFANELDLHHHERQVHGAVSQDTKIHLEFRVRRSVDAEQQQQQRPDDADFNYGLDGQAFVPAALPERRRGGTDAAFDAAAALHPLHVQRTEELRQRAAGLREEDSRQRGSPDASSFPSLARAAGAAGAEQPSSARLNVGWASGGPGGAATHLQRNIVRSRNAGAVTDEDFPTLGPSEGQKKVSAISKIKKGGVGSQQSAMLRAANAPVVRSGGGGWGSGIGAAAAASSAAAAPPVPSSGSFLAPIAPRPAANSAQNLTADNFPSLGGGSGASAQRQAAPRYAAAEALARRNQVVSGSGKKQQTAPSWNSTADFPLPPTASSNKTSVRDRVLGDKKPAPSISAVSNILRAPASSNVTVEDMKASLGTVKYKQLKNFTKEFAAGELAPDTYVDHAASLFDQGSADPDFWLFLPSLLASCPNQSSADQAVRYMENLRRMRNGASNVEHARAPAQAPSPQWSSPEEAAAPPPARAEHAVPGAYVAPPPPPVPSSRLGKSKNAWASGTTASVKSENKSLTPSTAAATPAASTATTSYVAMETKQQNWQQAGGATAKKGKKKNKQKNELRALAFRS